MGSILQRYSARFSPIRRSNNTELACPTFGRKFILFHFFSVLSNTDSEYFFLTGAATVILSINALQYIGGPLLNLTIRGETNERHRNLSVLSACAFSIFLIIGRYKEFRIFFVFRLVPPNQHIKAIIKNIMFSKLTLLIFSMKIANIVLFNRNSIWNCIFGLMVQVFRLLIPNLFLFELSDHGYCKNRNSWHINQPYRVPNRIYENYKIVIIFRF